MKTPYAKILYVEDDLTLSYVTKDNLELRGYMVDFYYDGQAALESFAKDKYNVCILDIMLPKLDGYTLAEKIRKIDGNIPIIFLTAKSTIEDKIRGLTIGADDYITKPFSIEELTLKIEIFLKRPKVEQVSESTDHQIFIGNYIINTDTLSLTDGTSTKHLTHKEAELFRFFYENRNTIIKREDILWKLWGDDDYFKGRSLDVFISRLRKFISEDNNLKIENIHGIGFRFKMK